MRCYKKPFSRQAVEDYAAHEFYWGWKDRTREPEWLYFVHVCSFRFVFVSLTQIAEYRAFYDQPRKPAFRSVHIGRDGKESIGGDTTSAFACLPLYLWQKGKREKVVAALDRAIREFAKEG